MEDPFGDVDSLSVNSLLTGSTVSIMDPPSRLEKEYDPLRDVYASRSEPLPLKEPGIKDSNSRGEIVGGGANKSFSLTHSYVVALIQALKALQLKIKRLEEKRVDTADHFKHLSEETLQDRDELTSNEENTPPFVPHPSFAHVDHSKWVKTTAYKYEPRPYNHGGRCIKFRILLHVNFTFDQMKFKLSTVQSLYNHCIIIIINY